MAIPPPLDLIPLGEAIDRYLDNARNRVALQQLSPRTLTAWAADLGDLAELVGEDRITDEIDGHDIDDAVTRFATLPDRRHTKTVQTGRSLGSMLRFTRTMAAFFKFAQTRSWIRANPLRYATQLPIARAGVKPQPHRTALSGAQAQALLAHGAGKAASADKRRHPSTFARDRLILHLLTVLGPRVAELAAANLEDFKPHQDLDDNTVWWWVIQGKGRKTREVPLSALLRGLIDDYLAVRPDPADEDAGPALLRTGHGNRISARDIERVCNAATANVQAAEPNLARRITPHALRHTAATILVAAGWDLTTVRELLGHSTLATTDIYIDTDKQALAKAISHHPLTM
ncbi:MAG: tyrosine-type recombinase/integrase [Propionibacteriaceae bacterium]|jgi:site-specific recombinase XerD|nr:tyrosine-type recombinase/integrase [Propionibacteriaceae bacterium]